MKVLLTVTEGPHKGRRHEFREHDTFIVGRAEDSHFRLPVKDKTISRFHLPVGLNPPYCRPMDMASTNGTAVNGRTVHSADPKDRDIIAGGRTTLVVAIDWDDLPASVPAPTTVDSHDTRTGFFDDPLDDISGEPTTSFLPNYRIDRELGRGGVGVVYLAYHRSLAGDPADRFPDALAMRVALTPFGRRR